MWSFVVVVLAIISIPGPSNALLFASGALAGWRASMHLPIVTASCFAFATAAWVILGLQTPRLSWGLPIAVKVICVCYLVRAAWNMWRKQAALAAAVQIRTQDVVITALLNPKALLVATFAFALPFSRSPALLMSYLIALWVLSTFVSSVWLLSGSASVSVVGPRAASRSLSRATAIVLATFALVISASMLQVHK